jgi:hypothetical protein
MFFFGKLKHEIVGKTIDITLYSLVKDFSFSFIQGCQIPVQHHSFTSYFVYPILNTSYYLHKIGLFVK